MAKETTLCFCFKLLNKEASWCKKKQKNITTAMTQFLAVVVPDGMLWLMLVQVVLATPLWD